jgi:hypothetical protein
MYCLLDGAIDFTYVAMARAMSPACENLFSGQAAIDLEDVAPYVCLDDENGMVSRIVLKRGDLHLGLLLESESMIADVRRHLRHFLWVKRESDQRVVYFRYYDPRVLREFLPVCTTLELDRFFGPISAFVCPDENPEACLTFRRFRGKLMVERCMVDELLHRMADLRSLVC